MYLHLTHCFLHIENDTLIGSAVSARLTLVSNRHTDNRLHHILRIASMATN